MDDVYAINVAKAEIREAYGTGDVERFLVVLDSDLIDYSDGRLSCYGDGAKTVLGSVCEVRGPPDTDHH